jgi:hypothetical protein
LDLPSPAQTLFLSLPSRVVKVNHLIDSSLPRQDIRMSDAEDVCGCLVCAVLCGVCCVAAAEEDKRERERAAAEAMQVKNPSIVMVNPVAVSTPYSQLQKKAQEDFVAVGTPTAATDKKKKKKKSKKSKDGKLHKRKMGSKHREPPSH